MLLMGRVLNRLNHELGIGEFLILVGLISPPLDVNIGSAMLQILLKLQMKGSL